MVLLAAFPDAEYELCQVLPDAVSGLKADTVTPADWTGMLPFCRVTRTGGGDDRITDTSFLTVDVFAATRAEAMTTFEAVRQYLTQEGGVGVFDLITSIGGGPKDLPWNDQNNPRRLVAEFVAAARRQS